MEDCKISDENKSKNSFFSETSLVLTVTRHSVHSTQHYTLLTG